MDENMPYVSPISSVILHRSRIQLMTVSNINNIAIYNARNRIGQYIINTFPQSGHVIGLSCENITDKLNPPLQEGHISFTICSTFLLQTLKQIYNTPSSIMYI